ncbi:translocation/assembly module TamB domain-containing protein [Psychromonas marina]|nr:translocation/assembly module TamB domain-containing protein [Psychromonas marina]
MKISKYSLVTLLSLFAITALASSFLLLTHSGNQLIISLVKQVESRLSVELEEGSLLSSPTFSDITWLDGETQIKISHANYQFDWGCLFNRVCLDSLTLAGVQISLPETSEAEEPEVVEDGGQPLNIDIPIALIVGDITVSELDFTMGTLAVNLDKISLQADAFKKDVTLASQISGLLVTLPDSAPEVIASKPTNSSVKKQQNLQFQSIAAILTDGMLPTVSLPINLTVDPINIDTFELVQNKQTLFALNKLDTQFTFKASELAITQFAIDIPETKANLTGNINFIDDYPLNITLDGQIQNIKQLEPATLLKDINFQFTSNGSLSNLNSELRLSNKIDLQLRSHLDLFADNLPHQISLDWQNLQWPLTGDAQYRIEQGRFVSKGSLLDYQIELQSDYQVSELPAGNVSLKTNGGLQHLQIESLNVETLSGNIDFSGLLAWKEKIDWLGELSITDIDLAELETEYEGHFSGNIKQQVAVTLFENADPEWQFDFPELAIVGELLTRPLTVSGRISGDDKQGILFDKLAIDNDDNSLLINGYLATQNDLAISLNIVDVSHLMLALKGGITGTVNVTGPSDLLQIESSLVANSLTYQDYQVGNINLDGEVLLSEKPQISLTLNANNIIAADQLIDDLAIKITHDIDAENNEQSEGVQHKIELLANSELISTDLAVFVTQTDQQLLVKLNNAIIDLPHQTLTLSTPFDVVSAADNIEITPHCWQAKTPETSNAGRLCITQVNIAESGNVVLDIDKYLLANLTPFLPAHLKLQGALSANADLQWQKDVNPTFLVNLFSDDMLLKINTDSDPEIFRDYAMETFKINLEGKANEILVDTKIYADKLIDVNIKGQLQPYNEQPTLDAKIISNLPDFSLFLPLIPALDSLEGQLSSEVSITGKLDKPTVNGKVNIRDSLISSTDLPMNVKELSANIEIVQSSATLQGSFNSSGNNTITEKAAAVPLLTNTFNFFDKSVKKVGGKILHPLADKEKVQQVAKENPGVAFITGQFDWSNTFMGDIHFYAQQLEIYDYGKIDLLITPDISISFNDQVKIDGDLFVDKGKIVVKELAAGAISESSDIVIVDVEQQTVAPDLPVIIDLSVDLGNSLQIVALGLDTFIGGKLLIEKPFEKDLSINGVLQLSDGSYRALGQQLTLQDSRIIFQGAPESPYLQIEAIRDPSKIEDDVTAGVRVTGPVDELELVIFSEPAMAQQEALSYLTRGQGLNSSSDSSTMANMLIDIAAGQSDNLMSSIGEEIGIKDLSLSSSGTGDEQSVGIRGEIAPGVEISYGVGVFDTFSILSLRYEILERLYIEASSGIYQAVDAYYEWDWDKRE